MWISKKEILELSEGIQKALEGESFDPRDEKEGPWSIFKMNNLYTAESGARAEKRRDRRKRISVRIFI